MNVREVRSISDLLQSFIYFAVGMTHNDPHSFMICPKNCVIGLTFLVVFQFGLPHPDFSSSTGSSVELNVVHLHRSLAVKF